MFTAQGLLNDDISLDVKDLTNAMINSSNQASVNDSAFLEELTMLFNTKDNLIILSGSKGGGDLHKTLQRPQYYKGYLHMMMLDDWTKCDAN